MKTKKFKWKQAAALATAFVLGVTAVPFPGAWNVRGEEPDGGTDSQTSVTQLKVWDFADGLDGWKYDSGWQDEDYQGGGASYDEGNGRLAVDYSGNVNNSWWQIAVSVEDSGMPLSGANNVTLDFYFDSSKRTTGSFTVKAFSDKAINVDMPVDEGAAETVGGTIKKVPVSIDFDEITQESVQKFTLALVGVSTDYKGTVWLDNISINRVETSGLEEVAAYHFDSDAEGWGDGWGSENVTGSVKHDPEKAMMKIEFDFSNAATGKWRSYAAKRWGSLDLSGVTSATADIYFDAAQFPNGMPQLGLYADKGEGTEKEEVINSFVDIKDGTADPATGLTHAAVKWTFEAKSAVDQIALQIGATPTEENKADYKGTIWVDNLILTKVVDTSDIYVDATKTANEGNALTADADNLYTQKEDGSKETTAFAGNAKLADPDADEATAALYEYLSAVGKSESVIFGHQNDTWHKAGTKELSSSDTYDVVRQYAGIVGIDALSLVGQEYSASRYNSEASTAEGITRTPLDIETLGEAKANVLAAANLTNENIANGSIITLSAHIPNFSTVKENADYDRDTDPSYAKYDFSGYSPNTLTGDVANEILPGGKYNEMFRAYLDMIADYAKNVEGTILFRPFHEGTGSWFWWGAAFCNAETFKNDYRYAVTYLRDVKDVHNILYVYGPGSEASSAEEYAERYPGDEYVDMVGFDMYHSDPTTAEETVYFNNFANELKVVGDFAKAHGKLFSVTETGLSSTSRDSGDSQTAAHKTGNTDLDWYNQVLEKVSGTEASYFLLWANFGTSDGFYTPYVTKVSEDGVLHGHEMLDYFIDFYNDGRSIFAADQKAVLADLAKTVAAKAAQAGGVTDEIYGYLNAPIAGRRMLGETDLFAQLMNYQDEEITFVLKGDETVTLKAEVKDNTAAAVLSASDLKKLGERADGTITLAADGKTLQTISMIFNIEEPEEDPYEIDNFENYYGVKDLLTRNWSTNKDTGCTIDLSLTDEADKVYDGSYSMVFSYEETATGWAGATISKEVSWADCDALQFYTIPDGKNQKVVIQLTANGMVYEAYLNLYEDYAADTDQTPLLVTIPFKDFVQRDTADNPAGGLVTDCSQITSFGLWVNAIEKSPAVVDGKVSGTIYYDKITAVKSGLDEPKFEKADAGEEPGESDQPGSSDQPGGSDQPSGSDQPGGNTQPGASETIGNQTVDSVVSDIKSGSKTVSVDMVKADGSVDTVIPQEVLEAAKGTDTVLKFNMGDYAWTINGKDITGRDLSDINLKVTFDTKNIPDQLISKTAGNDKFREISLAHDGEFGFKAELEISLGKENEGKYGNLYYYDKSGNGKLVWIDSGKIGADGKASLTFSHASDYVIVIGENQSTNSADTSDSGRAGMYLLLMMAAAALLCGYAGVYRKRNAR